MADDNQNNNKNDNDNKNKKNNFFNENPLLAFAIFSIILILVFKAFVGDDAGTSPMSKLINDGATQTKQVKYSEVKNVIKSGNAKSAKITPTTIEVIANEKGKQIRYVASMIPTGDKELTNLLEEKKVVYEGIMGGGFFSELISMLIPILIFFAIWMFIAKRMSKSMGGGILGVGKSDKLINAEKPNTRFSDVAGAEEAKEEVKEIVDFLKYPERYIELGAKIPKGVLLVGPPGTGKTLLAKAVAGEASVPFFSVSGSSFIEMFVGVGASRVRDLFAQAKKESPSIIFIDEIDAIGKSRASGGNFGGNDEREQTLNQLLAEMDGFGTTTTPVIVLAATNRPEILDAALLRAGRFDRQVLVDKPDYEGRLAILQVHIKDVKLGKNVDLEEVAKGTAGLAGADLANIINEAALLAGRNDKKEIEQSDLMEAIERAFVGLEKKNRKINELEKKIVAYHESGHALIAELTKGATRVTKVSIIPRGLGALGYTLHLPDEENRFLSQKHELLAEIDVLLAGRAAEEVFLGEISTGASNDLDRATNILEKMIMNYGMSDVAGLMVLSRNNNSFLGGGGVTSSYSEKIAEKMDEHIIKTLNSRYEFVKTTLKEYSGAIENTVAILLDVEVIEGVKVREIIDTFEKENNLTSRLAHSEKVAKEKADKRKRDEAK
ncbi:MAG: ATP-dependent zinc metalloprotease FtsH [Sulfurovaceae bacterium]|nr:ATP-dependent zinc metalloprotease FtsH [Sulfurovaceae bacterium]